MKIKLSESDLKEIVCNHFKQQGYKVNENSFYLELTTDRDDEYEYPVFEQCEIDVEK